MNQQQITIRQALRQQLIGDQKMGLRSVPLMVADLTATLPHSRSESVGTTASEQAVGDKGERLRVLDHSQVRGCTLCKLSATRTQTVFGQGNPSARLVFVGEAPGFEEDRQGLTFVGRAGDLLTKMIIAMGLTRDDVFICNVLKCRPPNNRDPAADEILHCSPYLREQLSIIKPEVLIALGSPASKTLLNTTQTIGRLRGRFHDYQLTGESGPSEIIPLMPTYHPAYLLRSPDEKTKTWSDLQMVMQRLGLPMPNRS